MNFADNMWFQFAVDVFFILLFLKWATDSENDSERNMLMAVGFLISVFVFAVDLEKFWPQLTSLFN